MEEIVHSKKWKTQMIRGTKGGAELLSVLWDGLTDKLLLALKEEWPAVLDWHGEYDVPGGYKGQQWDIGGLVATSGVYVVIEEEVGRPTAVRNVNKTWMACDKTKQSTRLVQVFSPLFHDTSWIQRFDEAAFIGRKAQVETDTTLSYLPIQLELWPLYDQTLVPRLIGQIKTILQPIDEV